MAHFAKLENGLVIHISVVDNDKLLDEHGVEQEALGVDYLLAVHGGGEWVQTSYNANIRHKYASIGDTYLPEADVFVSPQPFPSWTLSPVTHEWEPPVAHPAEGDYTWNEATLSWQQVAS